MVTLLHKPWFADRPVLKRSRQIAGTFSAYGISAIAQQSGLNRFAWDRRPPVAPPHSQAERLRLALGELGATFTKLGQMLSTRGDLVPVEFTRELAKLQDAAPPVALEDVRRTIELSLGAPPEAVFASFDAEPIASASIGQVHGAVLPDGTPVVVKVRRPGVLEQVEIDLRIVERIAAWTAAHGTLGEFDLRPLVEEFAYTIRNELDHVREGQNADRLRRLFGDDAGVLIPRVHWDYTTTSVLTLDRVHGTKISDLDALDALGISRRAIAKNAVRIFLREVLEFGFFHADPHPGNFFVQPDASIAIVDFGMVGRVSESLRDHLLRAGLAARDLDAEALAEELYALGVAGRRANRIALRRDLDHLIGRYGAFTVRELSATTVVEELTSLAFRHRLQLPSELALLLRVVSMSEGMGLTLDPDFRYLEFASPIFKRRWAETHSLRATAARLGRAAVEAAELSTELPRRASRLVGRLERGELEMNIRHEGLDRFTRAFQSMTNRLALAMILSASVVALSVALGVHGLAGIEHYMRWLFGFGFAFSLAFGVWLLTSIWRSRH